MGVTRVNINSLPKNPLQYNLPGGDKKWEGNYYQLPVPITTNDPEYPGWVAARTTKSFILW